MASRGMALQQKLNNNQDDGSISSALEADSYVDEKDNEPTKKENAISHAETKLVARSRVVFVIFLAVVTVVMGVTAFRVLRDVEEGDFATRFDDFARQVIEVSQINANNIFARYQTMALQMTAASLNTQDGMSTIKWPYVQMQGFEAQAVATVKATGAAFIAICPIVQEQQRAEYEAYAMNHREWLQDTLEYHGLATIKNVSDLPISPVMFSAEPETRGIEGKLLPYHVPVAQISSAHVLSFLLNTDIATDDFADVAFEIMNTTRGGVMTNMQAAVDVGLAQFGSLPGSFLVQPIFESYDISSPIVGIFTGFLFWSKNFENLLPAGSEPLILVVENCDAFISFEIRGPQVTYLGFGDGFRDTKYDVYERKGRFVQYQSSTGCEFLLRIYPTAEFESAYRTNSPFTKTAAIVGCFIATALVFGLYNVVVEYRQKKLVTDATKTSALVGSLFPETVRDRLIEYAFTKKEVEPQQGADDTSDTAAPIADCFECATVYFADIAGFTKWSSSREPAKVFILLETLYNAFDLIARRMGVFKVETIGDCYMAVTGLPKVRDDHAVIMVRFARSCLTKMSQLLPRLEQTLGEGTLALSMRVGIHSGPVTAGVLRGEKSRFQLFGDTVNTASRMESNGQPGRIHVSEATAKELIRWNRSEWIVPRKDTIVAKGKGEMKTYFVDFGSVSTANLSSSPDERNEELVVAVGN